MKALMLVVALFVVLPSVSLGSSYTNPEELGGVGVLHVTPVTRATGDAFFPQEVAAYHVTLDGVVLRGDSTHVEFNAMLTDSTGFFTGSTFEEPWDTIKYFDGYLVAMTATWERDGHRLVYLRVQRFSALPLKRETQ